MERLPIQAIVCADEAEPVVEDEPHLWSHLVLLFEESLSESHLAGPELLPQDLLFLVQKLLEHLVVVGGFWEIILFHVHSNLAIEIWVIAPIRLRMEVVEIFLVCSQ